MTKLDAILEQLPAVERSRVEDYAQSLLRRRAEQSNLPEGKPNRIRLDELEALLVRMTDDMSDAEIKKRLRNEWADAAED
jgi:hypothetical protein